MFLEKIHYGFLSRMRRPEGLPPKFERNPVLDLGAPTAVVYEASLSVSLFATILAFLFFPTFERARVTAQSAQEFVEFEDIENTRQENRPPPPPRPPIVIEAPSDEALEDVQLASTDLNPTADVPPPPAEDAFEDQYFVVVEEMPQVVGGIEAIWRNVVYPEIARRAGVQGRVYVLAFIDEQGNVTKAEVLKGIGAGCDEAALAAVLKAKFIPGKQRGKPMKVRLSIPIRFQLSK